LINGVTATTDIAPYDSTNINNIVNGAGLPGNTPSLTGTHARPRPSNAWIGLLGSGGNINFNLNGTYDLAGFSLWNSNGNNTIGVRTVNVLTSTDGTNFTPLTGAPTQFSIGAATPEQFSFVPVNASYVQFQVLSNYNNPLFIALDEVQFNSADSATSVPEPFTILGTLTAMGGGAALKRRIGDVKSKSM
jgi:F5/8 type C domain